MHILTLNHISHISYLISSGALDCHPSVQALCDAASGGDGESGRGSGGEAGRDSMTLYWLARVPPLGMASFIVEATSGATSGNDGNNGNDSNDGDGGNSVQYEEDDFEVKGDGMTLIFHQGRLTHIVNKNGKRKEKVQTEHTLNID